MLNKWFWVLLLWLGHGQASFQYFMPLVLDEASSGYQFNVPADVYQRVQHTDLRDLRVINLAGDEVPMRVTLNEDAKETAWSEMSLPVFTLQQVKRIPVTSQQTRTSWQGDKESFTVTTSEQVQTYLKNQQQTDPNSLLIDASAAIGQQVVSLTLDWSFATAGNRVFYVDLKGSDDLANWRPLLNRHKLIELDTGGRVVLENSLPLNKAAFNFYQLVFHSPEVPFINQVKAKTLREFLNQPIQWNEVGMIQVSDRADYGHSIEWDVGGYFPIEGIRLGFDYPNLMAEVRLFSKPNPTAPWRLVSQGSVYDVGEGDMSMFKNQLEFPTNQHRYWRLTSQSTIKQQWVSEISFAWRAHRVQFLAQGEGPFTLRFGSNQVNSWPPNQWYQTLKPSMKQNLFSSALSLGELVELAQSKASKPEVKNEFNYSRWVFWSLLAVVLVVLGIMAVRLLREVGDED